MNDTMLSTIASLPQADRDKIGDHLDALIKSFREWGKDNEYLDNDMSDTEMRMVMLKIMDAGLLILKQAEYGATWLLHDPVDNEWLVLPVRS